MKNVTVTSLSRPILIVELSEGLSQMRKNTLSILNHDGWVLLGKPDEIKEEDIEQLVEWGDADPSGDRYKIGYRSYFDGYKNDVPQFTCKTPIESLFSLLESEIYWKNPYSGVLAMEFPTAFDNFQLRTFDRNRTLIFKKN